VIAAAVSYGQLQDLGDTDVRAAQQYPYVQMLPDRPDGFHPGEIAGRSILTLPLESDSRPSSFISLSDDKEPDAAYAASGSLSSDSEIKLEGLV
jgi:hypothetical protein